MITKYLDPQSDTFHIDVKAARTERGLTQQQFAEALGVNQRTVCLWEAEPNNNLRHRPRGKSLHALREFLGAPLAEIPVKLTLAQAKRMLAESFGVPESAIEITVKY